MLIKLFVLYVYLQSTVCGCGPDKRLSGFEKPEFKYKLKEISKLDRQIVESSGLAHATDSTFWTHSDGDNPANLFEINLKGELLQVLPLELQNKDWEDLAEDDKHIYIGDFGNNANNRQDLRIYKVSKKENTLVGTIDFKLEDQLHFPPLKNELHFDLEAFFFHQDSLYLFSKSRGKNKKVKLYSLPAEPGNYTATLKGQRPLKTMTTAADISPDGNQFAVLSYGRLYLFNIREGDVALNGQGFCIPISRTGQAEAVLYLSQNQLLITNEKGRIYQVDIRQKNQK